MLVIRLSRTGKTHDPHYRIVVQERRSKLNGKALAVVGHYHPAQTGKLLVINKEEAENWLKKGAQVSDTVTNLFVKEGIFKEEQKVHNFFTPKNKKELEAEKAEEEKEKAEKEAAKAEAAEAWAKEQEKLAAEKPSEAEAILEKFEGEKAEETPAEEKTEAPAEVTE